MSWWWESKVTKIKPRVALLLWWKSKVTRDKALEWHGDDENSRWLEIKPMIASRW